MRGHTIVCGDDALAMRIVEELNSAGASVVMLSSADELVEAGISHATAIICVAHDDATNLEIALLAREANPNVRVVARLVNTTLREAVAVGNGPGAILEVADLAASSVVESCLSRTTHAITIADKEFIVSGTEAPRDATLRELFGDLAPVAVIRGESSSSPGKVVPCPGRDLKVQAGDWTSMLGTADELAAQGIRVRPTRTATSMRHPWVVKILDGVRMVREDVNPMFYRLLLVTLLLLLGSTVILRYAYKFPGMTWVDALYFSSETIATVGYGDFNFIDQPNWLRLWGVVMMFAGVLTLAVLVAFISDLLITQRFVQSAGRRRARHLRRHVIVVGLGSFGIRVVSDLKSAGYEVVVIETNDENRYLSAADSLDVPVIFGDATLRQTLEAARINEARAVAVLTQDDMVNVEIGIVLKELLGPRWKRRGKEPGVPVVLRVYDRALGAAVAHRFGFANVRSTVELATPWFIGAAMGLEVIGTFSVGQRSFMVGGVRVDPGSELDGLRMLEISTHTRVIAISRSDGEFMLHPRRDAQLNAGDTAYLVGPYRELLDTLRKGQFGISAAKTG
jgi:Trk K+ transport system NAD-binding subunit